MGRSCQVFGEGGFANGYSSKANGNYSTALSSNTIANSYAQTTIGAFNKQDTTGNTQSYNASSSALIIGNGSSSNRSNAFRISFAGAAYANAAYNSTGADYAEYFEWEDGNPNNEDRAGYFVSFAEGEKIKIAQPGEEILGVISGNAAIIGDSYEDNWQQMYVTDVYGRLEYENVETQFENEMGEVETRTELRLKINPDYDPNQEYIPRSQRKEWSPIGLLGKLVVMDDGTCESGKPCMCNDSGIATKAESGYRVLRRLDESHVLILFK
jgi:hypothetical protein